MDVDEFKNSARIILNAHLNEKGAILCSSINTLKKGNIYILGLNPAGVDNDWNLASVIDKLHLNKGNSYLDEEWSSEKKNFKIGEHPIQKRLKKIAETLGLNLENICASNIVFFATRNSRELDFEKMANVCWPLHEEILKIVQPKIILTYGVQKPNSAFEYLKQKFKPSEIEPFKSGHGNWNCFSFRANNFTIIGIPHLSYYHISNKEAVLEWMKNKYQLGGHIEYCRADL